MPRYLIPIGGNEKKTADSEIFQEMVELAGGPKARIVVVPTASENPKERALDYHGLFSAFNPESIQTVHIGERTDAGSKELTKIVSEATLFMFGGGGSTSSVVADRRHPAASGAGPALSIWQLCGCGHLGWCRRNP